MAEQSKSFDGLQDQILFWGLSAIILNVLQVKKLIMQMIMQMIMQTLLIVRPSKDQGEELIEINLLEERVRAYGSS